MILKASNFTQSGEAIFDSSFLIEGLTASDTLVQVTKGKFPIYQTNATNQAVDTRKIKLDLELSMKTVLIQIV